MTGRESIGALWNVEHKYTLLGGVIGAFITITVIQSMDSLGPAKAAMLIVIAQLIVAYVIELLGLFGMEKQPLEYPSAGSTFKRPEGYFAGKLIMDAGLRGYSVGDAQVSEKHCGFVVNKGEATAADVLTLIKDVQETVLKKFGVKLEPEVKMIGEF